MADGVNGATGVADVTNPLSLADVVNPNFNLDAGLLQEALIEQRKVAGEKLKGVVALVLSKVQQEKAVIGQEVKRLEAELAALKKKDDKINAAVAYTNVNKSGIFALAAVVGQKEKMISFAREAGLIVPAPADDIWCVPKTEG